MISLPAPTTILVVRHTDVHNPQNIVYGRLPRFGLSAIGREEAARTAAALAGAPISAIYTSPQLRARKTATAIAGPHPGVPLIVTPWLAEVKTGWQGTPNTVMAEKKYNFYRDRVHPDDEDVPAVLARMLRWVAAMLRRHARATVVGVTHGDPAMMLRLFFLGQQVTIETLRQPALYPAKGSITRLVFDTGGPLGDLRPVIIYEDPSEAQHRALEEAAAAARKARGEAGEASPWAATSEEGTSATLPPIAAG